MSEHTYEIRADKYEMIVAESGALRERNTYLENIYIPRLAHDLRDMIKGNEDLDDDFKKALIRTIDERVDKYEDDGAIDNRWLERKYSEIKGRR